MIKKKKKRKDKTKEDKEMIIIDCIALIDNRAELIIIICREQRKTSSVYN